jgi:cytidylate kinase
VTVWTISWEEGSRGETVARLLAERAGVPLVDSHAVAAAARSERGDERLAERRLAPWLADLAQSVAPMVGGVGDRGAPPSVREMAECVVLEAARSPCVVADRAAFAILADHPDACHVRIRAPLDWRIRTYARDNCLSREVAEHTLVRAHREPRVQVQRGRGIVRTSRDDFTLVCDSSRFRLGDLVGILLLAGTRVAGRPGAARPA